MGDAVVAALVKDVLKKLTSEVIKEFGLLRGLKHDILSLKEDFTSIQAVLQDAEEKRVKSNAVELWLRSLRSASLEVENVLDEISTEDLLQRLHKKRVTYRVRAFFSPNHNKFMSRVRIAHKVKDIRRKLSDINSKGAQLSLTRSAIGEVDVDVTFEMPDRETTSLIQDSSFIFGRDEESEMVSSTICNKHIGKHENGEIRVYGIWGMGGLGKTTLAQLVYNHERVKQYFELKCWVYVSEKFNVQEIMKKIIESIDKCGCTLTQLETLHENLQRKLTGKKFLLVLDDVWVEEDKIEKTRWEELRKTLSCGAEESIVVMTTRSQSTCQMFAMVPELKHKLGCLSKENSWLLFKKLAFAQRREGADISELESIGREIVQKCKGLPLAVKTLGSLMWSKSSISEWQYLKDNNIWELKEVEVLPALKLSYDNLVPHLKRCFAYCCLFPKGYEMNKDVLISLWVSNGFIPPRGGKDLYMLGEEILNCLVWRSFFIVNKNSRGQIIYVMHDLMHDMAQHVMRHDCLVIEPTGKEVIIPDEVLHLSSTCPFFHFSPNNLGKLTSLRSILMLRGNELNISQIFSHKYLRVLYLCRIRLRQLPDSVYKLKHLIYLNLSSSSIEVLSDSIMYLQNLQVLLLFMCEKLCNLPEGIRYMKKLQHLDIIGCPITHLPLGIKELSTSLRILSRFPIGKGRGASIWELGDLNLLEGHLEIERLENVRGLNEAKSANLKEKRNLSHLTLCWPDSKTKGVLTFSMYEEVLEGLEPNPCLKGLNIYSYNGKNISPSWMVNLSNLVTISYHFCRNCEHLPTLGRLPNLRHIELYEMDSLKCFHDEDMNVSGYTIDSFPCVETIKIGYCRNLVALPSYFPKLKVLRLRSCDGLLSLPDKILSSGNLNKLEINYCEHLGERYTGVDWPKISHIPYICFDLARFYGPEDKDKDENEINYFV